MKYVACLLAFLFFITKISSQKVDMDKKSIPINHTTFPEFGEFYGFKTYQVGISESPGFFKAHFLSIYDYKNRVDVQGFKKTGDKGEFKIDIIVSPNTTLANETKTESYKSKDGKTNYNYYHVFNFYIPIVVRLLDPSGKELKSIPITGERDIKNWSSDKYSTSSEMNKHVNNKWDNIRNGLIKEYLDAAFVKINTSLTDKIGLGETKDWIVFYKLDSKNHPEFVEYDKNIKLVEACLKTMKRGKSLDSIKPLLTPTVQYFKKVADGQKLDDKHQFELKKYTVINLIQLNFFLNEFGAYKQHLKELESMDAKGYWDAARLDGNDLYLKRMNAIGATDIYMIRDLSNVEVVINNEQSEKTESNRKDSINRDGFDIEKLKKNPTDRVVSGKLTTAEDKELDGYFVIGTNSNDDLRFEGIYANVRFAYFEKGEPYKQSLTPKKVKSMNFENLSFVVKDFKESALGAKTEATFMLPLEENSQISLYRVFTEVSSSEDIGKTNLMIVKPGLEKTINISTSDLIWKKKLKPVFESCPKIMQELDKKSSLIFPGENQIKEWVISFKDCK